MKKRVLSIVMAIAICLSLLIVPVGAVDAADETSVVETTVEEAATVEDTVAAEEETVVEETAAAEEETVVEETPAATETAYVPESIVFQTGNKTAWVNGQPVEIVEASQVINGRTMVPFRVLAEALDCSVEWIPASQQILITKNTDEEYKLLYQIGNTAVYKLTDYGEEIAYRMDVAPLLSANGNTLLPARYVSELLGYTTNWADAYDAAVIYPAAPMHISKIKAIMADAIKSIDADVTVDSFTTDEERFAANVYKHLNDQLVSKGERSLKWSADLSLVCDQRVYERQVMNKWVNVDDESLVYTDDRQKLYERICGKYYLPETEFCFTKGTNALWLVQQVRYDEESWATLTDEDYTQVAVSAVKVGDGYRVLVILSASEYM